jgi:hypothetical protein
LVDPRTPAHIKYVGQTVKVLKRRLQIHVAESLRHSREDGRKLTRKENWIISLLNENVNPEIVLIEEVDSLERLDERESFWIAHCRAIGQAECNFKDGGAFSVRNLKECWATRNKELGLQTTDEKKTTLLGMPEGSPRPKKIENMGLTDCTTRTKDAYDEEFDKRIRIKFPHWFNDTRIAANKEKLLSLPLTSFRPTQGKDFGLSDYIKPNGNVFDPVFDKAIREKFPHWFDGSKRAENGKIQAKILNNGNSKKETVIVYDNIPAKYLTLSEN